MILRGTCYLSDRTRLLNFNNNNHLEFFSLDFEVDTNNIDKHGKYNYIVHIEENNILNRYNFRPDMLTNIVFYKDINNNLLKDLIQK